MATPWNSLRFLPIGPGELNKSPPTPVLGDLGRCPSHQSHLTRTNTKTRMDRPKSIVGVIRGVTKTVDVSCLLSASSGIYGPGVRYLRAVGYFSLSQCATGPAMESRVCQSVLLIRSLPGDSAPWVQLTQQEVGNEVHSREGGAFKEKIQKNPKKKIQKKRYCEEQPVKKKSNATRDSRQRDQWPNSKFPPRRTMY